MLIIKNLMEDITYKSGLMHDENLQKERLSLTRRCRAEPSFEGCGSTVHTLQRSRIECKSPRIFKDLGLNHFQANIRFNYTPNIMPSKDLQAASTQSIRESTLISPASSSCGRSVQIGCQSPSAAANVEEKEPSRELRSMGHIVSKQDTLNDVIRKVQSTSEYRSVFESYQKLDWIRCRKQEFLQIANGSILTSCALQNFILQRRETSVLEVLATKSMEELIYDQYGCQVLRLLVKKSSSFILSVKQFTLSDSFKQICTHMFASKVLQTAAECDDGLKIDIIDKMIEHWDEISWSMYTNSLFKILIKKICNTSPCFARVCEFMQARGDKLLLNKYDKRFLVDFIDRLTRKQLAKYYKVMCVEKTVISMLDDKTAILVLLAFTRRRVKKAEDFVVSLLKKTNLDTNLLRRHLAPFLPGLRDSANSKFSSLLSMLHPEFGPAETAEFAKQET